MVDCGRSCLGHGAPQGVRDPSLGRAIQAQFRKHRRSGKSTGIEPQYSLQTLLQRYRRRPQTSSLLPWKRGRKPDGSLLGDEREALLNECIDEFYLRPERPSLAALHLEVRRRFVQQTLAVPNYRTVRRRVEAGDARTRIRRRDGAKKARELGPLSVSSLQPQRALEVVQIDHTLVDAIVVHRENRQPIGRPWLTLAVVASPYKPALFGQR